MRLLHIFTQLPCFFNTTHLNFIGKKIIIIILSGSLLIRGHERISHRSIQVEHYKNWGRHHGFQTRKHFFSCGIREEKINRQFNLSWLSLWNSLYNKTKDEISLLHGCQYHHYLVQSWSLLECFLYSTILLFQNPSKFLCDLRIFIFFVYQIISR